MRTQAETTEILSYLVGLLEKLIINPSLSGDIQDVLQQKRRFISEGMSALDVARELHYKKIDRQIDREPAECDRVNFIHRKIVSLFSTATATPKQESTTKQERQQLRIALAGETSAGKTALLNTILHTNILYITQEAATHRLTEIRRDPLIRVEILDQSGLIWEKIQAKTTWFADEEYLQLKDEYSQQLKDFIARHTGTRNGKSAKKVRIYLPAPLLPMNVTLLDTPGFNAYGTDSLITKEALSDCHACLFVIDARNALKSKELDNLLSIRSQVSNTFIVLNKMDLVQGDDDLDSDGDSATDETINRVRELLAGEFGDQAAIYPVSALPRERLLNETKCYADNLKSLITEVFQQTKRRHITWLTDRLLMDIQDMAPTINDLVYKGVLQYESELRQTMTPIPPPLEQFAAKIKDNIQNSMFYHASAFNKNFIQQLEEERIIAEEKFQSWVNIVLDKPTIQRDAQLFARHYLKQALNNINVTRSQGLQGIAQAVNRDLTEMLTDIYRDFTFKTTFQSASIISILISLISIEKNTEEKDLEHVLEEVNYEKELVSEEVTGTPPGLAMLNSVGVLLGGAIGNYLTNSTLEYTKQKISQTFQVATVKLMEDIAELCKAELDYSQSPSFISQLNRAVEQQIAIYEDTIKLEAANIKETRREKEEKLNELQDTAAALADTMDELAMA